MRKVYALWACTDYEPSTLVGIFASELGAKERLEQIKSWLLSRPEWPDDGTESEEDDAWKRLEKWREDNPDACLCETSDRRIVEEFELQGSKPRRTWRSLLLSMSLRMQGARIIGGYLLTTSAPGWPAM